MDMIRQTISRFFPPKQQPLPPGVYSYQSPADSPTQLRLHLRIEPSGDGVLIVNASTVLHLNATAVEYAYHIIKDTPELQVADEVARRYNVPRDQALADFKELREKIATLVTTPDLDPVSFLDIERRPPYITELSAPYRLDCALTYRMSEGGTGAPVERVRREMTETEWKTILDKAWAAGIPHVIFTGGEPTLRPDLCDLVAHAEALGMVTGLLTDGLRLSERNYLHELLQSGIDHLMIVVHPDEDQSWEALRDVIAEDIFTTAHLTLTPRNAAEFPALLKRLADMMVKSISLSVSDPSMADALQAARNTAAEIGLNLVWDLPVPYSNLHPVALELGETEHPEGAGRAWLYVEPDGDVLPAQGINTPLGNLLTDPWETIWTNRKLST